MSQLGSKKVCKLEDIMELGYAVKKSRLWENEAFSKNKNYDSGFLPHEHRRVWCYKQPVTPALLAKGRTGKRRARRRPTGSCAPGVSAVTWPPGQGLLTWVPRTFNEVSTAMGLSWPSSGLDSLFQCRGQGFDPWLGS